MRQGSESHAQVGVSGEAVLHDARERIGYARERMTRARDGFDQVGHGLGVGIEIK